LNYIMPSDWRESDNDADYEIEQARKLLIEFVGGEPGKRLHDQFAAGPIAAAAPAAMPSFDVQPETSHSDAKIIELGREFERLRSVELSLEKETYAAMKPIGSGAGTWASIQIISKPAWQQVLSAPTNGSKAGKPPQQTLATMTSGRLGTKHQAGRAG
jgi:hypothetical protein